MKQIHLNIFLIVGIIICGWLSLRDDKKEIQPQQINYNLFRYKNQQLQERIDSLSNEIIYLQNSTDSIKIKIINDESKVDHASNNDVDSMFSALFNRHR